jgi:hypothetical protein
VNLWRRHQAEPSEDARHAVEQAHRQLADAQALGRAAEDLVRRADESRDRWLETRQRNHVAEAVVESIRRRVQHP